MKQQTIAQAAALVTVLSVASKILGFVRDQIVAHYFGASGHTDAFVVAQTLPNLLTGVVLAAIGTAFLPVFAERLNWRKGQPATPGESSPDDGRSLNDLWRLSDSVFTLTGLLGLLTSLLGVIFAPGLVHLVSPGFEGETFRITVLMMRIIFPGAVFGALFIPAKAVLNSLHHFTTPALSSLVQNALAISGLIALAGFSGLGIKGAAIGWGLGFAFSFLLQVPALRHRGFRYRFRLDFGDSGVRKTFMLAGPVLLGATIAQVSVLVDRSLASGLPAGSIAALNFADKLRQLPLGIFATAVATVIYPTLAEMASKRDLDGVKETMGTGLRLVALMTLPAAFGLAVLREPLVRILFERGAFNAAATASTAAALLYYSVGMLGLAANSVLNTTFYSLRDMTTPVVVGAIGTAANVVFDYLLVGRFAHTGIALASSIASLLMTALLLITLRRKLGAAGYLRTGVALAKIAVASLTMAGAVALGVRAGMIHAGQAFHVQALSAAALMGLAMLLYGAAVTLLGVEEANRVWRAIERRVRSRASQGWNRMG